MNFEKLNQLLTLFANIGVLAGIVFLAIELRQNTDMMEAQTRDSLTSKQLSWTMAIATDLPTAIRWTNGNRGAPFTEPGERAAYSMLIQSSFRIWENEYYQYQKGLFTETEFRARANRWRENMQNPSRGEIWCDNRFAFSEDFQEILNSYISDNYSCTEVNN